MYSTWYWLCADATSAAGRPQLLDVLTVRWHYWIAQRAGGGIKRRLSCSDEPESMTGSRRIQVYHCRSWIGESPVPLARKHL